MFAVQFDEIVAKATRFQFLKGSKVNAIKLEIMNYYSDLNKEDYVIKETDDVKVILEKMEKLESDILKYTVKTDFSNLPNAMLDYTHVNLQRLATTYSISDTTKEMKFKEEDLRTMIAFIMSWNDFILSKPVYVMMVKNKLRKVNDDVTKLSDNIFESADANLLIKIQK